MEIIMEQAVESNEVTQNDTLTSLVDAAEPQLGEGEYFLTEGIKGTGDTPEWFKADKYKSIADQAKAYTELEKRFGGFKGAPKDGYQAPEGIEQDDALFAELKTFAEETNMSQDAFDRAWGLLQAQSEAVEEVSLEAEMAKLGDNATGRIKHVEQFMKNNLDPDTYERLRYSVNSAESVELVEALIKSTAPAKLPIDGVVQPGGITWESIEAEMYRKDDNGNLLRSVDRNHEAKIQRMMKEYGGDRPYTQTFG
jgi:hypothetical protein